MTLKIDPNPTFWWPCQITLAGQKDPATLDVEFRHKNKAELEKFREGLKEEGRTDEAILAEVIVAWKGADRDYDESALRDLLANHPASGFEILTQYLEAHAESRRKNLKR